MNMLTDGQTPAISSPMRAKMRQIDRSGPLCRSCMSQIADSSDVAILYIVFLYDGNITRRVTLCTTHVNESPNGTCLPTFKKKVQTNSRDLPIFQVNNLDFPQNTYAAT